MNLADTFCLNSEYSTTRMLTKEQPRIENDPSSKVQTTLFLPSDPQRKGEGGLRTKGYFKRNLKDRPLLTIVTVVYNGSKYLAKTIESVLAQNYDNVEYIIIDGGSTDGTLDIIRKYEYAIDYWISEKDQGIYHAMNKGIDLTSGDWINFMNAGDRFYSDSVLSKAELCGENEAIVYGDNLLLMGRNSQLLQKAKSLETSVMGMPFCHQSAFYNSRYSKLHKFNCAYTICSDYDFTLAVHKEGSVRSVDSIISVTANKGISDTKRARNVYESFLIGKKHKKINKKQFVQFILLMLVTIFKESVKQIIPETVREKLIERKIQGINKRQ